MIDANTQLYCIIGKPIRHSFSPYLQNAAFQENCINAVYTAFEVRDLENAIKAIKTLGIAGASITIPYKVSVLHFLDEVSDFAGMIGSVNTIINKGGRLFGTNTDSTGFYKAISEKTSVAGKTIALFGAGGAGKAIAFSLFYNSVPKELYIIETDESRTKELINNILTEFKKINKPVDQTKIKSIDRKNWIQVKDFIDIIINATPTGMEPDAHSSILNPEDIPEKSTVMDIVYNPHNTLLLKYAGQKGCNLVYGVDMLLYQGVQQFELWTGQKAPVSVMRKVLLDFIEKI